MNNPSGSVWRKWDLHIHTPSSIVNYYSGANEDEKWENFLADLEALPQDYKVLGINDYLFLDGDENRPNAHVGLKTCKNWRKVVKNT